MLLLLDNCEHLIEPAPAWLNAAASLPAAHILATSREASGDGRRSHFPCPVALHPGAAAIALSEIARYEAVLLFAERAAANQPGFLITEANAPAVAQICRRLDGIPLAIELAAARMRPVEPGADRRPAG